MYDSIQVIKGRKGEEGDSIVSVSARILLWRTALVAERGS